MDDVLNSINLANDNGNIKDISQMNRTTLSTYYQECEEKEIAGAIKTLK